MSNRNYDAKTLRLPPAAKNKTGAGNRKTRMYAERPSCMQKEQTRTRSHGHGTNKRKPGPDGPGLVRQRGGAGDTFQRGTTACTSIAYLGGWQQPIAQQHNQIMRVSVRAHNAMADMSAMRSSQSAAQAVGMEDCARKAHSMACHMRRMSALRGAMSRTAAEWTPSPRAVATVFCRRLRNSSVARWRPGSRGTPAPGQPI
jgi:hypothetical protein